MEKENTLRGRVHRCLDYELNSLDSGNRDDSAAAGADDGRSSADRSSGDAAATGESDATGQEKEATVAGSGDDGAARRDEESKSGLSWLQTTLESRLILSTGAVHERSGVEISGILADLERWA